MRDTVLDAPISSIMERNVVTVDNSVAKVQQVMDLGLTFIACETMRNTGIHHLVVTRQQVVAGIVSSLEMVGYLCDALVEGTTRAREN